MALLAIALLPPASAEPPSYLPDTRLSEILSNGDVSLQVLPASAGAAARVQAVFHTTARQVWLTLEDCEANFRFVPGLRECELLELDATRAVTRQVLKPHWYVPRQEFTFTSRRQPYDWVEISLQGGDFKQLEGSWRFEPIGDPSGGLLVTHEIRLKPHAPAPRWLIQRTLGRDLPDMMACLRFVAGGSLNSAQAQQDQSRCASNEIDTETEPRGE